MGSQSEAVGCLRDTMASLSARSRCRTDTHGDGSVRPAVYISRTVGEEALLKHVLSPQPSGGSTVFPIPESAHITYPDGEKP